jgi:SAM-dependent methyltransferase
MMQRLHTWSIAVVLALATMGLAPHAQAPDTVMLAVPGHANATPWIASDGRFVAVAWGATADGKGDVYVATSDDEGATFGPPVRVNAVAGDGRLNGEIPPRVALHRPAGAARPDVVVAWNAKDRGTEVKIARSRDGGRTFAAPSSLQAAGAAGDRGWHSLTVDAQGTAHVVWLDHRGLAEPPAATDATAGAKAGAARDHHAEHDGVAMAMKSRLHYAALGAAGPTTEQMLAPGVCYCCKTALVPTSRGVLAAWRHVYAGNMRDIAFTWLGRPDAAATPARVNEDGWAINGCPDDGPAMAVGARDRVHIVWPTVIPGPEPMGALFYAEMTDGVRFGPRQRVPTLGAPKPSHPQVVVDGTGRIFVAWDEMQAGVRTAAMVEASVGADGAIQFGTPAPIAPGGPTQYPVMAPLARGIVTAWTSGTPQSSVIRVRTHIGGMASGTAAMASMAPAPTQAHAQAPAQARAQAPAPAQAQAPHEPLPPQQPGADHMEHRFDDPARYAKSFDDPARDAWQQPDRVITALALTPGQKVADIGAGTGYFSVRLARATAKPAVFAVDLEPKMVEHLTTRAHAEHLPNLRAVQATTQSPNLPEPVDVVLVVDTYHHIGSRATYFAALRKSLRPGGRVAIVDFRKGTGGDGPPEHFRFLPEQITAEMAQAGYVLERAHDFLPRQLFLVYRAR